MVGVNDGEDSQGTKLGITFFVGAGDTVGCDEGGPSTKLIREVELNLDDPNPPIQQTKSSSAHLLTGIISFSLRRCGPFQD